MARIAALLLTAFTLTAVLPAAAEAGPKKCKKGYVLKKVKKNGKTVKKCVNKKPKAPATDQTGPAGGETVTPPADGGTAPPAQDAQVRNDQALLDALTGAAFYKTYNGGAGYGSYAYNFLSTPLADMPDGRKIFSLRYCTYYVSFVASGSALRENFNGGWVVKEGYTHPSDPGLVTGIVQLWRQGMPEDQMVEAPVAVKGTSAAIKTGNGSTYFEPGDYSYKGGQATTECSVWEPA